MRKEDQDRINRFSRLHSREKGVGEELKLKEVCQLSRVLLFLHSPTANATLLQKEKEDLEEISSELELADEDDKVP